MKNVLLILSLLCPLFLWAQFSASGLHYEVPGASGVDHVLIFHNLNDVDAALVYTGSGIPKWTTYQGVVKQSGVGAETFYPEDATGYLLYEDDSLIASCYVLDYQNYKPDIEGASIAITPQCDKTILTLTADLPHLTYRTTAGVAQALPREATVSFTSLGWGGEEWQDSLAVETVTLQQGTAGTPFSQDIELPPFFRNSTFSLVFDPFLSTIGVTSDSIVTAEVVAIAVCAHPTSVTVSRNYNNLGVENEPSRPIDEATLSGSAPLEINFLSNGNKPTALYYKWQIFKGSDLLVERFDEDQRYTFMTNGAYQVKVWVYNDYCMTDSTVFDVSVTESMLRVPNVFTPNGDGSNDEFRVVYRSLAEFHCWIYNRWGKLVYKWDDPAKGWDGTINGLPAAEGAYYYIIRARGTDAKASDSYHKATKRRPADVGVYQLSGSVSLIRGKKK